VPVIGTAGHVDHGKSALVEALTGIDPDRLAEEKARGLTIELGFARLKTPYGVAGIVDVPGHEDFIRNMLAGVGGIDAALLVVAADEGPMPQTHEHLSILDLLGVSHGVVALTKSDLVDTEWLELVRGEVHKLLEGTVLEGSPVVAVSVRDGRGLEELREALGHMLRAVPPPTDQGRPYLPIDRAFSMVGFGTVVTGTLQRGTIELGQTVEILPHHIQARIRGLQTHGRSLSTAQPGSRVAVNLAGVSHLELSRGDVLALPGQLGTTRLIDVHVRVLAAADRGLQHNRIVDFYTGASQVQVRVRLLGDESIRPGQSGYAQFRLGRKLALATGDGFILRQASPSRTIGGGVILDAHPPRRWRRFRPEVIQRLTELRSDRTSAMVWLTLEARQPCTRQQLERAAQLDEPEFESVLQHLMAARRCLALPGADGAPDLLVTPSGWQALLDRLRSLVAQYHRHNPLRQGMPIEHVKQRLGLDAEHLRTVLAAAAEGGLVENRGRLSLIEHRVQLSEEQQRQVEALLEAFRVSPFDPPSVSDAANRYGRDALAICLDRGDLVRVSEDVAFASDAYRAMVARVTEFASQHGSITVAQARDLLSSSRKYMLALLGHMDQRRLTRRIGDARVLRVTDAAPQAGPRQTGAAD
jgi:selenocysteine-specific elongation factor